jgi:hypothetical protein
MRIEALQEQLIATSQEASKEISKLRSRIIEMELGGNSEYGSSRYGDEKSINRRVDTASTSISRLTLDNEILMPPKNTSNSIAKSAHIEVLSNHSHSSKSLLSNNSKVQSNVPFQDLSGKIIFDNNDINDINSDISNQVNEVPQQAKSRRSSGVSDTSKRQSISREAKSNVLEISSPLSEFSSPRAEKRRISSLAVRSSQDFENNILQSSKTGYFNKQGVVQLSARSNYTENDSLHSLLSAASSNRG